MFHILTISTTEITRNPVSRMLTDFQGTTTTQYAMRKRKRNLSPSIRSPFSATHHLTHLGTKISAQASRHDTARLTRPIGLSGHRQSSVA